MIRTLLARVLMAGFASTFVHSTIMAQNNGEATPAAVCASKPGERQTCEADTKGGVTLVRSLGVVECELGKTWGYDQKRIWVSDGCSAEFTVTKASVPFGSYKQFSGFKLADTEHGDLSIKLYTYVRYLNQTSLDQRYEDDFGNTFILDRRQDVLFQKAMVYFLGWIFSPRFRYLTYVWTSNASMGLGAQLVLGGNLQYTFNDYITLAGGINGLPGVRATEGQFPLWLTVDNRLIADEFFRPSYTMGFWVKGKLAYGLHYQLMLGNNLSQLGVDAGQLDDQLNTFSAALAWSPTTGEFGTQGQFGDFEQHKRLATRIGVHFTRSTENFEGQPNTEGFENVQIRLSDGSVIFTPGLFGPGVRITDANYQMTSTDGGLKYRGFAIEGEYYWRWVNGFDGPGTEVIDDLWDHGFQLQTSAMVVPKKLQLYVSGSKVFGEHGDPYDTRAGVNWYPFSNQNLRWNTEYLHLRRSPVGALSLPYPVGGNGSVVYSSVEIVF
jgi:hypothetical protein